MGPNPPTRRYLIYHPHEAEIVKKTIAGIALALMGALPLFSSGATGQLDLNVAHDVYGFTYQAHAILDGKKEFTGEILGMDPGAHHYQDTVLGNCQAVGMNGTGFSFPVRLGFGNTTDPASATFDMETTIDVSTKGTGNVLTFTPRGPFPLKSSRKGKYLHVKSDGLVRSPTPLFRWVCAKDVVEIMANLPDVGNGGSQKIRIPDPEYPQNQMYTYLIATAENLIVERVTTPLQVSLHDVRLRANGDTGGKELIVLHADKPELIGVYVNLTLDITGPDRSRLQVKNATTGVVLPLGRERTIKLNQQDVKYNVSVVDAPPGRRDNHATLTVSYP